MKKIKILHIRSSYFYGGPERQISYLTQALNSEGIESGVATFAVKKNREKNRYYKSLQDFAHPSHLIEVSHSFDPSAYKSLENLIRSRSYTLIVGHDYRSHYFVSKLSRRLGLTGLAYSRGWTTENLKVRFYEWLDIRFMRKIDGVIAVSKSKYKELKDRGIPENRLIYIPNSINTQDVCRTKNKIRSKFGIPESAFLIGTAGRLSAEKNHETLIQSAINLLDENNTDSYFIIAGEGGRENQLRSLIPESYRKRIILAGWIEDNDSFYADLDLFVLTSLTEGFPNVLLEAGKYNLPVISTPAGGAVEIISDSETGLFIPFREVGLLQEKIKLLHDDRDLRKKLGDNLGRVTREKYGAAVNAALFLDFARETKNRAHPSGQGED